MKVIQFSVFTLLFSAYSCATKMHKKNVPTFEVRPGAKITGNRIEFEEPDCDSTVVECQNSQTCKAKGAAPKLSADQKYFACCLEGQHLVGNPDTAFDCCAEGHDLAGSVDTGYHCCPIGHNYDGQQCKQVCKNGKQLKDGKCVCPTDAVDTGDGTCKPKHHVHCDSGLQTGKCYAFTSENGNKLGLYSDGIYYAEKESMSQRRGKFQLCADEKCTPGKAVNPSDKVYIKDLHGDVGTGANSGQWLNNAQNGAHIGQTTKFANAGQFTLSKWPCGKYCLGGFEWGIGPACPAETPAMTFYTQDSQMCVPFDVTEVPCDVHADQNNCLWKNGDQCCNKVDCSTH